MAVSMQEIKLDSHPACCWPPRDAVDKAAVVRSKQQKKTKVADTCVANPTLEIGPFLGIAC